MNILIIYTSTGLGHKKIGENIGAVLTEEHNVDLLNLFDVEPGKFVERGQRVYFWILKYWPELWEFFYTNKIFLKLTLPWRTYVASFKAKPVLKVLENKRYDAVLSTHPNASAIVSYLKQKGMYSGKLIITFSDFHLHPYWLYDNADLYLANIVEQKNEMVARGIAPEKIAVCGITLPEKVNVDEAVVRGKYGLNETDKIVLIMGGSRGTGMSGETVSELSKLNAKLLVMCGTNERMKREMEQKFASYGNVKVLGWADPYELYTIADLAVTKPGGLTIAECLQYGLPILISHYLPGHERLNAEYLMDKQLIMSDLVDLYGSANDELESGAFADALETNPNVSAIVQHGSTVKAAISGM